MSHQLSSHSVPLSRGGCWPIAVPTILGSLPRPSMRMNCKHIFVAHERGEVDSTDAHSKSRSEKGMAFH